MPAKKIVTKEIILQAALKLVEREGIETLNMRSLANECKCSTQPIYHAFSGMDELKTEVAKKLLEEFYLFLENEIKSGKYPEYKAIGMGYIRFAVEKREFFKYLFMRRRADDHNFEDKSYDEATFVIMKNYGLYKDDAYKLHSEMWVFVHGIATMFATGYLDWDWDTVDEMVSDVFLSLTGNKNGGNK